MDDYDHEAIQAQAKLVARAAAEAQFYGESPSIKKDTETHEVIFVDFVAKKVLRRDKV